MSSHSEETGRLEMACADDELDKEDYSEHQERVPLSLASQDEEEEGEEENGVLSRNTQNKRIIWLAVFTTLLCLLVAVVVRFAVQPAAPSKKDHHGGQQHVQTSTTTHSQTYNILKKASTVEDVEHGAVASDHPVCSKVGVKILEQDGGNAVDAAVATALCLGVANPASSGIGGGAFILIHADKKKNYDNDGNDNRHLFHDARDPSEEQNDDDKVTEVIDCREIAPAAARTYMFKGKDERASAWGGLAVAVPGELRGLELAHSRHGRLPWAAVVEPAMRLARDGVPVGKHLAGDIPRYWDYDGLISILTRNNDEETMLEEGDIMTQPALADTLEAVMHKGADAVYMGYRAVQIARAVQQAGGIITVNDLHSYRPTLRSPLIAKDVNGYTLVGAPPPSSGGAAIIGAARFLAGYTEQASSDAVSKHRMVEAMRHAFAIRMSLSDPAFNKEVTQDAVNDLVRGTYMEWLRRRTLDNSTLPLSVYGGAKWSQLNDEQGNAAAQDAEEGDRRRRMSRFGYLNDHGTSHLSVVDKDRNAVSITSSVNTLFGSTVVSESTGIILNSQMDDFATPGAGNYFGLHPSPANFIKPRKKPLSSMSPTLVFRQHGKSSGLGELFMALGGSGGPKIITAVLQTLLRHAHEDKPLFDAMAEPRLHDQLLYHESAVTLYEKTEVEHGYKIVIPKTIRKGLQKLGHQVHSVSYTGCVQAVVQDPDTKRLTAVADIRKGGTPAGY